MNEAACPQGRPTRYRRARPTAWASLKPSVIGLQSCICTAAGQHVPIPPTGLSKTSSRGRMSRESLEAATSARSLPGPQLLDGVLLEEDDASLRSFP